MVFNPTMIAAGTTKTTMLLKIALIYTPTKGIKPIFTIPANIKAIEATKKGTVSFAVKLNKPTIKPNTNKVVSNACELRKSTNTPAKIDINKPTKNA